MVRPAGEVGWLVDLGWRVLIDTGSVPTIEAAGCSGRTLPGAIVRGQIAMGPVHAGHPPHMVGFRIPQLVCPLWDGPGEAIDPGTNALTTHRPPGPVLDPEVLEPPSAIMRMVVVPTDLADAPVLAPDATEKRLKSTQANVSLAFAYEGHHYFGRHGPDDPSREAALQFAGAYTLQFHEDNLKGWELQFLVQLQLGQLSWTSGTPSAAGGVQASHVWQVVRDRLQVSALLQALAGGVISVPRSGVQIQPSLGAQLTYQPTKTIQLTAQLAASFTLQQHGPLSFDPTLTLGVQVPF